MKIGNHALLREREQGTKVNDRNRYWTDLYGDKFYVCSQWGKSDHAHNACSLLVFLEKLAREKPNHPDISQLERYKNLLHEFVATG